MNYSRITFFIWSIVDLIPDSFKRGKYQNVILTVGEIVFWAVPGDPLDRFAADGAWDEGLGRGPSLGLPRPPRSLHSLQRVRATPRSPRSQSGQRHRSYRQRIKEPPMAQLQGVGSEVIISIDSPSWPEPRVGLS